MVKSRPGIRDSEFPAGFIPPLSRVEMARNELGSSTRCCKTAPPSARPA